MEELVTDEQYKEMVLALESSSEEIPTSIKSNSRKMMDLFETIIMASQRLDIIKKDVFYKQRTGASNPNTIAAKRLAKHSRLLHAAIGMATESGEILEAIMGYATGGRDAELDLVNIEEELGDQTWYIELAADAVGTDSRRIKTKNNDKLKNKRYKSGKFTKDEALNRDLVAEREVLEKDHSENDE